MRFANRGRLIEPLFEQSGPVERLERTILRDRLECSASRLDGDEFFQFWHPNALGLEIRLEIPCGDGRDVHTDAALLFGQTPTVDFGSANGLGPSNAALS